MLKLHRICSIAAVLLATVPSYARTERQDNSLKYHFDRPASVWEECFPLGNGRIGMMPDGGVEQEVIVLNEISMWTGSRQDADNPDAHRYLGEIRRLLFEGKNEEAQKLVYKTFTCGGVGSNTGHSYHKPYGSYQLFGNMVIDYNYPEDGPTDSYRREFDLNSAVASYEFSRAGVTYKKEEFISYNGDVAVIRLKADKRGAIGFTVSMNRQSNVEQRAEWLPVCSAADGDLLYRGRLHAGTEADDAAVLEGMRFAGRVRVLLPGGGSKKAEAGKISVSGADEAIILIAMDTDYFGKDPETEALRQLDEAQAKRYKKLKAEHIASYGELFGRVDMDFGHNAARELLPMDERLRAFVEDRDDPSLIELYYQFGRYLLIASTRPGTLPPNLQGIWAKTIDTPWNGDYHLNINMEMNHWPVESGNLGELHIPLIEWTKRQVQSGRHTAEVFYGARGWTMHILGNLWEFTAPGEHPSWGATNTSAAWLCAHLYNHFLYNRDKKYLSEVYPVMREAALFFVDMLVENPHTGFLVTAPTTSPENMYRGKSGKAVSLSPGSTMDSQIVRELFSNVIEAAGILGIDSAFADTLAQKRSRLLPTAIGDDGRIMEWPEPYEAINPQHRHVSHLYGLYPASEISVTKTPELAEAARKSLELRGDGGTGWSMAWKINFWARLHDGEHAYKMLTSLLAPAQTESLFGGGGTFPNLFCAHPPFQIDGNFGGCAGIAEMLVQSHAGCIELLPALPAALSSGSFRGLCVQGGAEISAQWKDGRVTAVKITAKTEGDFLIKDLMDGPVHLRKGQSWHHTQK